MIYRGDNGASLLHPELYHAASIAARLRDALGVLKSGRTDLACRDLEKLLADLEGKKS